MNRINATIASIMIMAPSIAIAHEGHGSMPAMSIAHTMIEHGAIIAIAACVAIAYTMIARKPAID